MLPAPFQGHPLQKRTEVQWDMRAWLHADGGANESMSPQLGISRSPNWSVKRRLDYIDWAKRVVAELRGASPWLEEQFDDAAEDAERSEFRAIRKQFGLNP